MWKGIVRIKETEHGKIIAIIKDEHLWQFGELNDCTK